MSQEEAPQTKKAKTTEVKSNEKIVMICRLEDELCRTVTQSSSCYTHFEYLSDVDGQVILKVVTYNRIHQTAFLLTEVTAANRQQALEDALKYVKSTMLQENNYMVIWTDDHNDRHTSYFRGVSEIDVRNKIFCTTFDAPQVKIEKVVLRPMS